MTLGIFPTMAPPHSACWLLTIFGFAQKVWSHKLKCGGIQRKASHMMMNIEMLRKELGDRS